MNFLGKLRCPITKNGLHIIKKEEFKSLNLPDSYTEFGTLTNGLIDNSNKYFYPIFNGIIVLHEQYALYLGKDQKEKIGLSLDKKRVFDYYNEINYEIKDSLKTFEDSHKWIDFREVSSRYIKNSLTRASKFYPPTGKYFLDIASGPVGFPEYIALSDGYEYRICVDLSLNTLIQAKINLEKAGKMGIYICGDISNIPFCDNSVDTIVSQHTLYHIPKNEQKTAVEEMYRVAKPASKIVIIYSWFYHSWFMNISLNIIQIYRILRYFSGKIYIRLFKSKPRLHFYSHSPRWFKKSFSFSNDIKFYCWRSTNKYFMDLYIHKSLFGRQILNKLIEIEDKYSRFMSKFGEYSAIIITKKNKPQYKN